MTENNTPAETEPTDAPELQAAQEDKPAPVQTKQRSKRRGTPAVAKPSKPSGGGSASAEPTELEQAQGQNEFLRSQVEQAQKVIAWYQQKLANTELELANVAASAQPGQ